LALEFTYYGPDGSVQQRSFTNNIVTIGSDPSCDLGLHSLAPVSLPHLSQHSGLLPGRIVRGALRSTRHPGPVFVKQDDILYVGPHAIRLGILPDSVAVPPSPIAAKKKRQSQKKSHPFRSCLMGCFGIFFGLALIAFGIYIWWAQPSLGHKIFLLARRALPCHRLKIPDPKRDAQSSCK